MPRVSVVIPSYNTASFLGPCLASVLRQTYRDFEIIIVDDGSTDNTTEVVEKHAGPIRYLYQANRGVSGARNLALSVASGEFVSYIDSDDLWHPSRLETHIRMFDEHPNWGILHGDVAIIDEGDVILHESFNRERPRPIPEGECLLPLLQYCHIQLCSVTERRSVTDMLGGFDERLQGTADYYRWIVAAACGVRFGYLDEPLSLYRWRAGQMSSGRSQTAGLVRLFEILLDEHDLEQRFGLEAARIARDRLWELRRELAYFDYRTGSLRQARQLLATLMAARPLDISVYRDFAKACVPPLVADWIRARSATVSDRQ